MSKATEKKKYRATAERILAIMEDPQESVEFKNSIVEELIEFCINGRSLVDPDILRFIYPFFCEMYDQDPLAKFLASRSAREDTQAKSADESLPG